MGSNTQHKLNQQNQNQLWLPLADQHLAHVIGESGESAHISHVDPFARIERYLKRIAVALEKKAKPSPVESEVMIPEDVADLLRINVKTVRELYHAGILPGWQIGPKLIRFSRSQLLECLRGTSLRSRQRSNP